MKCVRVLQVSFYICIMLHTVTRALKKCNSLHFFRLPIQILRLALLAHLFLLHHTAAPFPTTFHVHVQFHPFFHQPVPGLNQFIFQSINIEIPFSGDQKHGFAPLKIHRTVNHSVLLVQYPPYIVFTGFATHVGHVVRDCNLIVGWWGQRWSPGQTQQFR